MIKNKIKQLSPPSTIGIIGGGQLGKMIVLEAKRMGYNVVVLDPKLNSPAGQVADKQILADFNELDALKKLAEITDVITYEFEHINAEFLNYIENDGHKVYPSSNTLKLIQNKYVQKKMLLDNGIKTPKFNLINNIDELKESFNNLGNKAVLKTCKEGYDGKGNLIIRDISELENAYEMFCGSEIMIEEFINFTKEVSIVIARNNESIEFYPISENIHKNSILIKSIIPSSLSKEIENQIYDISKKIIETLDDYGVFCIEFFIDDNSNVLVNEIAPRPHNSGHYSIEGCICSQFEQIIRVICGMPLGSSKLRLPCAMYNILGSEFVEGQYCVNGLDSILELSDCHFHLYGKSESQPLKKIGHITAMDETTEKADKKASQALSKLKIKPIKSQN